MVNKWNEIPIQKEQREVVLYAERRDDGGGGFSDRDSFFAERPIGVGVLSSHLFAKHFVLIQSEQALFGLTVLFVVADSLKDLQKSEVADSGRPLGDGGIKQISVRVFDPYTHSGISSKT